MPDGRCLGCRHPSGSVCGGCGTFVGDGWDGSVAVGGSTVPRPDVFDQALTAVRETTGDYSGWAEGEPVAFVGNDSPPCTGCGRTRQTIADSRGNVLSLSLGRAPDGRWWCNGCFVSPPVSGASPRG